MSIVRVGTTGKYAEGWEAIFGSKRGSTKKKAATARKRTKKATHKKKK